MNRKSIIKIGVAVVGAYCLGKRRGCVVALKQVLDKYGDNIPDNKVTVTLIDTKYYQSSISRSK